MSGTWGNNIKYTIFGESHGNGIGIVIDNLPAGIDIDFSNIQTELGRRKPGSSNLTSSRNEADEFEILSGVFNNKTTGAPLCAFIKNTNQKTRDYDKLKGLVRPGHADFTGFIKYNGFNDYRGGGHFSGRLTASLVFAGSIAKQILKTKGIDIISHIYKIGIHNDIPFNNNNLLKEDLSKLHSMSFPTIDLEAGATMQQLIMNVKAQGDSIGGIIEAAILNLPTGLGSPFFDSMESIISHLIFSIPGVKGIEFGDGFALAEMIGSKANDEFYIKNNVVYTETNHCGGILGGITTGMPVVFRAAFKPTPSISLEQNTVNIKCFENTTINIEGRHDPCIVLRAIPVVEAVAAMAVLEVLQ